MTERIKPDWMHDCKFIDELADGEVGYTMSGFLQLSNGGWIISRNTLCSPIRRGTHDTMILREKDEIYVREGEMNAFVELDEDYIQRVAENSFPLFYKPFTLEEKVAILWKERRR